MKLCKNPDTMTKNGSIFPQSKQNTDDVTNDVFILFFTGQYLYIFDESIQFKTNISSFGNFKTFFICLNIHFNYALLI